MRQPTLRRRQHSWLSPAWWLTCLLALALGAFGTSWGQPAPTPELSLDLLLDRCLEGYGGPAALQIHSFRQRGKTTSALRGHGRVERFYTVPDRLRVETHFLGRAEETRVLAGDRGWRNAHEVAGPAYQAMVLQAARLALPRILIEGRERLEDQGHTTDGNTNLRFIRLPLRADMSLQVVIDETSGRILRSTGRSATVLFETHYSDFRLVEGVLFPFREDTSVMGQPGARTELEEITLHDSLAPELFAP